MDICTTQLTEEGPRIDNKGVYLFIYLSSLYCKYFNVSMLTGCQGQFTECTRVHFLNHLEEVSIHLPGENSQMYCGTPLLYIGISPLLLTGSTPTRALILHRITFDNPFEYLCYESYNYIYFNISPILNIQLHYRDFCECNCPFYF